MTKAYLKIPQKRVSYLPKISSRRFPAMNAAYKSDGGDPDPNDPDGSKRKELLDLFQSKIDTALATRATKEELKAISDEQKEALKGISLDSLRAMVDDKTGVMPKLIEQGLEIQRLQTTLKKANDEKPVDMSTRGQIKTWLESRAYKSLEGKDVSIAEEIKIARADNRKPNITPLELRAVASPMTVATVNSGSSQFIGSYQVEPGVNELVRAQPVFWDYVTKGRTNAATYYWINKANPQGAAAFIGPGVAKPGISFSMVAESSVAKKIADSAKTTTELLQDIDGMATFIEQELKYQVMIKVNSVLMTSAGSSTEPTGIQNLSTAYTLTSINTSNPNYMDAIRAAVAQLRSGWLQGAITVFINSIDAANMDLAKADASGVYLLPAFVTANGRTIAGATIVEDNNVPVGYLQAAMLQYYRILIYQDFTVTWGWENDDFTKNLVTAVGEMRLHQFFNDQYTGAFLYDSFANIKTAIAPAI
jgi:hypothetical protein